MVLAAPPPPRGPPPPPPGPPPPRLSKHQVAKGSLPHVGWNGAPKRGKPPPTPQAGSVLALLVDRGGEYPAKKPTAIEALQSVMKVLDHQRAAPGDVTWDLQGGAGGAGVTGGGAGES